jgi:hypothetical protein
MKYVLIALAGVLVFMSWLGTPGGQRLKRQVLESNNSATSYMPVE